MKTPKIIYLMLLLIGIGAACSDMDDYKRFIEGGEIQYTGKIDSVIVFSGHERVLITGLFTSDPKITNCRIYWNLRADSLNVPVVRTAGVDTLIQIIQLPENTYNFDIFTYDAEGNKSVPVNASGETYGDLYKASITNRLVYSTTVNDENKVTIRWRSIDKTLGAFTTEIEYITSNGSKQVKRVSLDDEETILENYKENTEVEYSTLYLPEALCIDTFRTTVASFVPERLE